jgi:FkbM family methyltransferase
MGSINLDRFLNGVRDLSRQIGFQLVEDGRYQDLEKNYFDLQFLKSEFVEDPAMVLFNFDASRSQLRQDLFVLSMLKFKRRGFFVEFGATNGVDLSNTFLLEKKFEWDGILVEPSRYWHRDLNANRAVRISDKCVWKSSGEEILFNEVADGELSTLDQYSNSDQHANSRKNGRKYEVDTISLLDLLDFYQAPSTIDYLSIDTEGSELDILTAFDFNRYLIKIITVEHNYTKSRDVIKSLLEANGFERRAVNISRWDDWYVHQSI